MFVCTRVQNVPGWGDEQAGLRGGEMDSVFSLSLTATGLSTN